MERLKSGQNFRVINLYYCCSLLPKKTIKREWKCQYFVDIFFNSCSEQLRGKPVTLACMTNVLTGIFNSVIAFFTTWSKIQRQLQSATFNIFEIMFYIAYLYHELLCRWLLNPTHLQKDSEIFWFIVTRDNHRLCVIFLHAVLDIQVCGRAIKSAYYLLFHYLFFRNRRHHNAVIFILRCIDWTIECRKDLFQLIHR